MILTTVHYETNIYALVLLSLILITSLIRKDIYSVSNRLLNGFIILVISLLVLETLSFIFDGVDTRVYYYLNYMTNFFLLLLAPLVGSFWASYIDYKLYQSIDRLRKRHFYIYPFLISIVLMVVNIFKPIMFSINSVNIYQRENFIWLNMLMILLILAHVLYMSFSCEKYVNKTLLKAVVIFSFIPMAAGVIQLSSDGYAVLWSTVSLGVVMINLLLETTSFGEDYLTGLFTREKMYDYVERLISKNAEFTMIMIDLDNYKTINDTYGHKQGDAALVDFSNTLQSTFVTDSFISRFGGDEFLIVINETRDTVINAYKEQLLDSVLTKEDEIHNQVRFSFGYSIRTVENMKTYDQLLTQSDDAMYEEKAKNKNKKRRKGD